MPLQDLSVGSTSGLGSRQSEPTPERTSWWDNFTSAFTGGGGDDSNLSNPEDASSSLPVVDFGDDDDSSADIYDEPEFTYEPEVYNAITDASTAGVFYTPDDILQEAYEGDMGGKGEDKPDPLGNMGVPPATLEDVTGTDAGALSNPDPLYKLADDIANPTITTTPLDQEAALKKALMEGQPSGLMSRPSSFTGSSVDVASNVPNWMQDLSAAELTDVLVGIREGTHDAETGERIEDVSPAAEAPDQQGIMASRNGPDVAPEIDTVPPVETVSTYSSTTDAVYTDFYTNGEEGDVAHVGQDSQNLTLPAGIVADGGVTYDGKEIKAGKNTIKAADFDASKVDMSKAYKKVGGTTYKREDYDSDEAWSKAVIEGFKDVVKTGAGDAWDNLADTTKQAVTKLAWNNGEGWAKYNTSKNLYKELAKDTKNKTTIANGILNYSTVSGGGASIGIAKARANAWNKMSGDHGFAKINKITADNTGAKTKFKYYDASGNLIHTETTSRSPSVYSSKATEIEKGVNW